MKTIMIQSETELSKICSQGTSNNNEVQPTFDSAYNTPIHILTWVTDKKYGGYQVDNNCSDVEMRIFAKALQVSGGRKILITDILKKQRPELEQILRAEFGFQTLTEVETKDEPFLKAQNLGIDRLIEVKDFFAPSMKQKLSSVPNLKISHFSDFDLHSELYIQKNLSLGTVPKLSIVIPFFKKRSHLENALFDIFNQKCEESVEVVLVDDGSDFGFEICQTYKNAEIPKNFDLRMVRISRRIKERKIFRAGFARNVGAVHARGDRILFLDSDISIPENYLQKSFNFLKNQNDDQAAILQSPRFSLSLRAESYYWHCFYTHEKKWSQISDGWKYVCTHSLNIDRQVFLNSCRFPLYYLNYGYEDVHLGYALWKQGYNFELFSEPVVHLDPEDSQELTFERWRSLRVTGELFLRNFMTEETRTHCFYLFGWKRHMMPALVTKFIFWLRNLIHV